MSIPAGLETLHFSFTGDRPAGAFAPVLVGVVGSGNLEVMIESSPVDQGRACTIDVTTSARGFDPIWRAVAEDFHARHRLAGVAIAINDMGATPAVVNLRIDQAVAQLRSATP